jgi:nitric oxide reductase activation protein
VAQDLARAVTCSGDGAPVTVVSRAHQNDAHATFRRERPHHHDRPTTRDNESECSPAIVADVATITITGTAVNVDHQDLDQEHEDSDHLGTDIDDHSDEQQLASRRRCRGRAARPTIRDHGRGEREKSLAWRPREA